MDNNLDQYRLVLANALGFDTSDYDQLLRIDNICLSEQIPRNLSDLTSDEYKISF